MVGYCVTFHQHGLSVSQKLFLYVRAYEQFSIENKQQHSFSLAHKRHGCIKRTRWPLTAIKGIPCSLKTLSILIKQIVKLLDCYTLRCLVKMSQYLGCLEWCRFKRGDLRFQVSANNTSVHSSKKNRINRC